MGCYVWDCGGQISDITSIHKSLQDSNSMSSLPDLDSSYQPTRQESGTALRDGGLDFAPLGDAMHRAQVTPWQVSVIIEAYNEVNSPFSDDLCKQLGN